MVSHATFPFKPDQMRLFDDNPPIAWVCTGILGGDYTILVCGGPYQSGRVKEGNIILDFVSVDTVVDLITSGHPVGLAFLTSPAAYMDAELVHSLIDRLPEKADIIRTLISTVQRQEPTTTVNRMQLIGWLLMATQWITTGSTGNPPTFDDQRIKRIALTLENSDNTASGIAHIIHHAHNYA